MEYRGQQRTSCVQDNNKTATLFQMYVVSLSWTEHMQEDKRWRVEVTNTATLLCLYMCPYLHSAVSSLFWFVMHAVCPSIFSLDHLF
jgi:inner membrane protein involved in colicin E2 resistance